MTDPPSHDRPLWTCVTVAASLRIAVALRALSDPTIPIENDDYLRWGREWFATGTYGHPVMPPLFPLLCGLAEQTGSGLALVLFAQVALSTLSVLLVHRVTLRIGGSPVAALAAGWLMALDPLVIGHGALVLSETLFDTLLLVLLACVGAGGWVGWVAAGVTAGALLLVRSAGWLVLVPLFGAWGWRARRSPGPVVAAAAVAWLVVLPWQLQNERVWGRFAISSSAGYNLAALYANGARAAVLHRPAEANLDLWQDELPAGELDPFEVSDAAAAAAIRFVGQHPVVFAETVARGTVLRAVSPGRWPWQQLLAGTGRPPVPDLPLPLSLALAAYRVLSAGLVAVALGAMGRARSLPPGPVAGPALAVLVIGYLGLGPIADGRFLLSVIPVLHAFGGLGAAELWRLVRRGRP